MIYAYSEIILVLEDDGKQNPDESCTIKYQKHVTRSYGYKLAFIDDKFSKSFKSYLGEDAVYHFINSIIEEKKYCSDVMKKHFHKELLMTKKDAADFENATKCWICDNVYFDGDAKVRDHYHVTG